MKKFLTIVLCLALMAPTAEAKKKSAETKPKTEQAQKKKRKGLFKKKKKQEQAAAPQQKPAPKPSVERKGMFNVTKLENDWFFEIPDSLIGRDFLTTTRYTSTPAGCGKFGGEMLNQQTVYFQPGVDNQLLLRVRLFVNVSDSTQAINRAITVSNENPIVASFKIESHKDKVYKIKVNAFLNEDNPTTGLGRQEKSSFALGGLMPPLSYIEDIKTFPLNTEVRMVKTYNSTGTSLASTRSTGKATFGLNLSFVLLPSDLMKPRYYDPRVGFFTHGYNAYNDDQQRVKRKIFASRWRLEPRPEDVEKMRRGELVEPVKPIVYYIDPATPKQWRKYLIAGVNDWQKAFEKAGFKNAIYALEWPEGEDSLMSMEDARYSVIRYLASPIANAYGPHVSDPRTGEILESHICWYHNVMSLVHDWYMVQASSIDEAARKMHFDEELMGQLIRFVSSHEVGHTLGLRHNFGASSSVPVEKLRDKAWVSEHGHTPSIMDYARFNYVAQPGDGMTQREIFPRINDYDCWAIEWGYTPMLDAETPDEDYKALQALFEKEDVANNPRLWWGDGETMQDDPRRQTEDLGDDAVRASEYGILNLKRELQSLPQWTQAEDDIYDENLETMYGQIRSQFLRYCGHVINNIGGQLENFKTNTQQGDVYRPQPRQKQLDALQFVERNILTEPTWLRDMPYAKRLEADPNTLTAVVATSGVARLIGRLGYLNDQYKGDEYLADLNRMIMKDVNQRNLSPYRKVLQTQYVNNLTGRIDTDNTKIRPYALYALKQLQRQLATATTPHAQALKDTIDRALVIK
ncbi:MAG: zinc-dependent metalloprotease [Bacteroidaceae bacterium]|nr:zinc-dependent metalloprotease [Bacteroidaceae bacterium]